MIMIAVLLVGWERLTTPSSASLQKKSTFPHQSRIETHRPRLSERLTRTHQESLAAIDL